MSLVDGRFWMGYESMGNVLAANKRGSIWYSAIFFKHGIEDLKWAKPSPWNSKVWPENGHLRIWGLMLHLGGWSWNPWCSFEYLLVLYHLVPVKWYDFGAPRVWNSFPAATAHLVTRPTCRNTLSSMETFGTVICRSQQLSGAVGQSTVNIGEPVGGDTFFFPGYPISQIIQDWEWFPSAKIWWFQRELSYMYMYTYNYIYIRLYTSTHA